LVVVAARDEVTLRVDAQRKLRKRARRWSGRRFRGFEDAERRLVARTEQLVRLGRVEAHRTTRVRADLRERDETLRRPVLPSGWRCVLAVLEPDQERLRVGGVGVSF